MEVHASEFATTFVYKDIELNNAKIVDYAKVSVVAELMLKIDYSKTKVEKYQNEAS